MKRRDLLASTAALAAMPFRTSLRCWWRDKPTPAAFRVMPFDLSRVRLLPGPFLDAMQVNRRFIMTQDPDRLLHMFRLTAGLQSSAEPLGGWEAPNNELRGHFVGHYLSACALLSAGLGDAEVKARGDHMVAELARCQTALGTGYLSAFPEELFDRLRADRSVWAPWYTVHKIMAGLLDMHVHTGNTAALDVLKGMARWTARWTQPLGEAHMARILEREYGGMNDVLYNLAAVTGNEEWSEVAHRFDHERVFAPLAAGRDELKGLHVNTTIPKIIGAARRYEITADPRYKRIAEYFWRDVTERRAYCTGGTSNGESWNTEPGILAAELSGYTQECCVTYNMLKLTRHVFSWTADPTCADYYERALLNGVLGTQSPEDGSKLYYVPLGSGYWKLFGTPLQDYWCCTGSGSESFGNLGDSIYFHDNDGVYVNLFIASQLDWPEKGLRLTQQTRFPEEEGTTLVVSVSRPTAMRLRIRVPTWATRGGAVLLNGRAVDGFAAPGGYFVLNRTWHHGDKIEVSLPMNLHLETMPDDGGLQAIMYGPVVLAGRMGKEGLTSEIIRAEPTKPRSIPEYKREGLPTPSLVAAPAGPEAWIHRDTTSPLTFRTSGQARDFVLDPLYRILDERYNVYWRMA